MLERLILCMYPIKLIFPWVYLSRNPFELTEEFIENFNNASETERKEAFIDLAKKMLVRCKVCIYRIYKIIYKDHLLNLNVYGAV